MGATPNWERGVLADSVQELSETLKFLQRRKAVDGLVNVPRAWSDEGSSRLDCLFSGTLLCSRGRCFGGT